MKLNIDKILADELFNIGAIQFGSFKLKLHEKNPNALLSPIYINLRTPDNPKPGNLTQKIVIQIGRLMHFIAFQKKLEYKLVVGIPNAGTPFAKSFAKENFFNPNIPLLELSKKINSDGTRHISKLISNQKIINDTMKCVIVVDDLITKADSKLEAINILEKNGFIVRDVIVLIDREQGGREELESRGYRLHSAYKISELVKYYFTSGKINREKYEETIDYFSQKH